MAGEGEKSSDFYAVLGLKKECTEAELRNAYKKLALRWHPDRCSSSGNLKYVEEAKKKFQAIQEAYSVLSDSNKKFLYDVGVYNCDDDDDDQNGMGDFLNEMAVMMSQNKSNQEDGEGSFEELKELFEEMFQSEIDAFDSSSSQNDAYSSCSAASLFANYGESSNKRDSSNMNSEKSNIQDSSSLGFDTNFHGFCFGAGQLGSLRAGAPGGGTDGSSTNTSARSSGRKQNCRLLWWWWWWWWYFCLICCCHCVVLCLIDSSILISPFHRGILTFVGKESTSPMEMFNSVGVFQSNFIIRLIFRTIFLSCLC